MISYGYNNADSSPRVDPLSAILAAAAAVVVSEPKSFFKFAENCDASSLLVGAHRYTRILCASKLLWDYSDLKSDFLFEKYLLNLI